MSRYFGVTVEVGLERGERVGELTFLCGVECGEQSVRHLRHRRNDNDRTTISLTGTYTPWTWFSHRLVTGLDVGAENNWTLYPRIADSNATLFLGNQGLGQKNAQRANRSFLTLDYAGSAKWNWRE